MSSHCENIGDDETPKLTPFVGTYEMEMPHLIW